MSDKESEAAVIYLESPYDSWSADEVGWMRGSATAGRTSYIFNYRDDIRPSCLKGDPLICANHVGECSYGSVDPRAYGYGTFLDDHYETQMPRYGIPLDDDAWKDGHP